MIIIYDTKNLQRFLKGKNVQAILCGYSQNPRTNGKSKAIQTKSHKEAYRYTLTKREKGIKEIYICIDKKNKRKRMTKSIIKSTSDNNL